jgi:FixJ family two-component response regulator
LTQIPLISIIDDDDLFRASMQEFVRSLGFSVCAFASAASFLQSTEVAETRCMILDGQMPEMSGISLQEHLSQRGIDIPIIFITAFPDEGMKIRALNLGAVCYLHKPLDLRGPLLRECIEAALDRGTGPAPSWRRC